ncbi:MAG: T9SS type A sorting domain-containing protein [Bacteroidetes bacterium]|nr:T9SS type A sorting domain-containing protein [Bacteroidota bacterium]
MGIQQRISKYLLIIAFMSVATVIKCQSYDLMVLANTGAVYPGGQYSSDVTLGEPVTGFVKNSFFSAQQGFHIFQNMDDENNTEVQNNALLRLRIYPVPFQSKLTLEGNMDFEHTFMVQIQDVTGKVVFAKRFSTHLNKITIRDVKNLPKGYYTLKVTDSQNSIVKQIIKK